MLSPASSTCKAPSCLRVCLHGHTEAIGAQDRRATAHATVWFLRSAGAALLRQVGGGVACRGACPPILRHQPLPKTQQHMHLCWLLLLAPHRGHALQPLALHGFRGCKGLLRSLLLSSLHWKLEGHNASCPKAQGPTITCSPGGPWFAAETLSCHIKLSVLSSHRLQQHCWAYARRPSVRMLRAALTPQFHSTFVVVGCGWLLSWQLMHMAVDSWHVRARTCEQYKCTPYPPGSRCTPGA